MKGILTGFVLEWYPTAWAILEGVCPKHFKDILGIIGGGGDASGKRHT